MRTITAFMIDDDVHFCKAFQTLSRDIFALSFAHTSQEALQQLEKLAPDVVFLDYKLNERKNGLDILQQLRKTHPELPVIMVTEHEEIDLAVKAMQLGALDYITKNPNIHALALRIEKQLRQQHWRLLCAEKDQQLYGKFIYHSASMQELMAVVEKIAATDFPILIQGETGTGKTLLARRIHELSQRHENPFVAINCSNLPPNLFESELFGHTKGAFTGAVLAKKGKLELADSGTIFLDEISTLPLESQAKILTAIEEKAFTRLGAESTQSVDVRVITATNSALEEAIENRTFREDLYYRLNVIPLHLPPLRQRQQDILPLANYFLARLTTQPVTLSAAAQNTLLAHSWPGNIRELKSVLQRSLLFNNSPMIEKIFLLNEFTHPTQLADWNEILQMPYESAKQHIVSEFQKTYLQAILAKHHGNISSASTAAGINRTTFYRLLHDLGLVNSVRETPTNQLSDKSLHESNKI